MTADEFLAEQQKLTAEIAAAKVWAILEFMSFYAGGNFALEESMQWLVPALPDWLNKLQAIL